MIPLVVICIAFIGWSFATKIRTMNAEIDDTAACDDWTEEHTR